MTSESRKERISRRRERVNNINNMRYGKKCSLHIIISNSLAALVRNSKVDE